MFVHACSGVEVSMPCSSSLKGAKVPMPSVQGCPDGVVVTVPFTVGIILDGVRWHVQAGHRLSIVTLEHHRSEISGVWTSLWAAVLERLV